MSIQVNRIFCAFPIFCPSEEMYQRNMDSVVSFVEYLKLNPHLLDGSKGILLDVYYGGWSAKDEWFENIKKYVKDNIPELLDGNNKPNNFVKVFRYDKNYGKAKVVNDLCFDYNVDRPDTQFLFTMDSDIKFMKNQVYFFDRLITAGQTLEGVYLKQHNIKKPFGMISLNQDSANYHWLEAKPGFPGMDQGIHYEIGTDNGLKMKEELVWSSSNAGIAGGALFLNAKLFRHIGGYRNFNSQYCGEDGLALRDIIQNGASACIIKTLFVTHPHPTDTSEYLKWKEECMKNAFEPFDEKKYSESVNAEQKWIEK